MLKVEWTELELACNYSIPELLDISIVIKIKGMQENADILWESDLLWLTFSNFIFLFTSFAQPEKGKIK